ncbi:nitrite/sulfite reductase, partial [Streptococcus pneumoniae]|nr:nitrite/sulfite reductase [Streptococcus pneumoniae]
MPPDYERWLRTNVKPQRQAGNVVLTVKVPQGNMTSQQMRAVAQIARSAGDGLVRITIEQNLNIAWVQQNRLREVYAILQQA